MWLISPDANILNVQREIRTANVGAKVGETVYVNQEPRALIKQGKKVDTISLDEFASQLYGKPVRCQVIYI